MPGLSVLVPCLNEAAGLDRLVAQVQAALQAPILAEAGPSELILVDDGSGDGTWEAIEHLRGSDPRIGAVRHARNRGIPAAWASGLAAARGEWICVIDADLQYEPAEISRLWEALRGSNADIVQGARAHDERRRDLRFLLSRGLCVLLNAAFGMSLRDNKSGFFLCHRRVLATLLGFRRRYRHWQCFVMVAAHHHGYRIHEMETPFRPRHVGRSAFGRLALGPSLAVMLDLPTALREYPPLHR
jgi:phenylacetate-CoA ligase